jgi:hypothetical protein
MTNNNNKFVFIGNTPKTYEVRYVEQQEVLTEQ